MKDIRYVFWDSDNTLVDTAEHHWRKHYESLKTLDINLGDEYREHIYTNNGAQNHDWISKELGLKMPQAEYLDLIDQWYFNHINEIQIRAGVIKAIQHFRSQNILQAVVSNGRRRSVMAALVAKDLAPRFEFILCKEDYEGRKPDPIPYTTALLKMEDLKDTKIDPAKCLVIEDDPLGVASAHAAGMQCLHRAIGDDFDILEKLKA